MSALYRPVKVLTGSSRSIRTIIIFYVDLALPFGLRSAPFIFNNVADMLEWILRNNYGIHIHYLDDYFTVGPPVSDQCSRALASTKATSTRLRVPLAPEKSVGPTTCIIFLGIELDSIELYARLPSDKLIELRSLITTWFGERSWTRRELESLVGKLQYVRMTYVLAQTLRCPAYDPAPPSLLSLIPGMQARHRVVERIVNRLEWGELLRASLLGTGPRHPHFIQRVRKIG